MWRWAPPTAPAPSSNDKDEFNFLPVLHEPLPRGRGAFAPQSVAFAESCGIVTALAPAPSSMSNGIGVCSHKTRGWRTRRQRLPLLALDGEQQGLARGIELLLIRITPGSDGAEEHGKADDYMLHGRCLS